jgi:hypothetical protein
VADVLHGALAGCGKTISVEQNFDGLHVWDKRRLPPQDSRARLAGRASRTGVRSPKFEVSGTSDLIVTHWLMPDTMLPPISPVPPFPLVAHRSRLALHAPRSVALADYFSILLGS